MSRQAIPSVCSSPRPRRETVGRDDIATYDSHVRDAAASGHPRIREYSSNFKAVASTSAVDARDHTGTTYSPGDPGVPIYWLGGDKVADDYSDLYDGSWDSNSPRQESGSSVGVGAEIQTGSNSGWHEAPDLAPGFYRLERSANRQADGIGW